MNTVIDIRPGGIALFSIFLGATGQFLFRVGMRQYGNVSITSIWKELFQIIFTPAILMGFLCFGVSSILWLVVISRWELSYAYPLVALGYVLAILYGFLFLDESVNLPKVLGSLMILGGISILGLLGRG